MARQKPKATTRTNGKEMSVMAWIEDPFGQVLMVKQAQGRRCWTLPGGKVRPRESLLAAIRREVKEEIGLNIASASPIDIYDRPKKGTVTILFRVVLKKGVFEPINRREVEVVNFRKALPKESTPSAKFFWARGGKS